MRFPPPDVVASWPKPNYVNPETRKSYLIPVDVGLMVIAAIMVGLRTYTRFFRTRCHGIEDWLIILALIASIGLTVTISLAGSRYGWNVHIWDYEPTPSNLIHERAISWASQMLYVWSSSLTKLSFLAFYRTIFQTRYMQLVTLGCIYFTSIYFAACVLTLLLECRPLSLYWHILILPAGTGGYCIDEEYPLLAAGLVNVFIDLVILILPIRTVLNLNINWNQRMHILSIFLAGAFVVGCSAVRVVATWMTIRRTYDVTWHGYLVWYWVGIEVDVGLICASLPACKSLLKSWKKKSMNVRRSGTEVYGHRRVVNRDIIDNSANMISFKGRFMMSNAHGSEEITVDHEEHPANWMANSRHSTRSTYSSREALRKPDKAWSVSVSGSGSGSVSWHQEGREYDLEDMELPSVMNGTRRSI